MVTGGGLCCGQIATATTVEVLISIVIMFSDLVPNIYIYIYIEYNPVNKILINEVYMTKGALSLQSVAPGKEV